MGRLNHYVIVNGDVEVNPSEFPIESNSESVTDPETTPIKSIDDDKTDHLLEFYHSEHNYDILDVDLQMLQAWILVAPFSLFYTFSTVVFHKY